MKGNGLDQKEVTKYITTNDEVKSSDDFSKIFLLLFANVSLEKSTLNS